MDNIEGVDVGAVCGMTTVCQSMHINQMSLVRCRLLLVDPVARLTIKQVLEHPWLREAPNTQLLSPAIMMDKVSNSLCSVVCACMHAYEHEYVCVCRRMCNDVVLKTFN